MLYQVIEAKSLIQAIPRWGLLRDLPLGLETDI
jgi:hypothetical protein